jgi:hypothetical protein
MPNGSNHVESRGELTVLTMSVRPRFQASLVYNGQTDAASAFEVVQFSVR